MDSRDDAADRVPGPTIGPPAPVAAGDAPAAQDAAWVRAARAHDEQAFGHLFDRWFDPVYDVAWRIVRNRDTAAEVAQEVFLAAWQGLDGLERPESFGGWVRRIARNRALNRLDRERRSTPDDDQASAALDRSAPDVDMTAVLDEREQRELVWAAASALGERDASLLDLHLRHGFGAGEIAEELGVTTNNAHQLLHRLKGRLGGAIRSWVLWRSGRCPGLDRAVAGAGVSTFGAEAVKVVSRHARDCAECRQSQQLRLAPEALFAAMPMALAPPLLKAEVASALSQAGVPLGGAAAPTGAAQASGEPADAPGSGEPGGAGDGAGSGSGEAGGPGEPGGAGAGDGAADGSGTGSGAGSGGASGSDASLEAGLAATPPSGGEGVMPHASSGGVLAEPGLTGSVEEGPGAVGTQHRHRQRLVLACVVVVVVVVGVAVLLTRGDGGGGPAETAGVAGEPEARAGSDGPLSPGVASPTTASPTTAEPDPTTVPAETSGGTTSPDPTGGAGTDATGTTGPPAEPDPTEPGPPPDPGPPPAPPEEPPPARESPPAIAGLQATPLSQWCGATPSAGTTDVGLSWQSSGGDTATLSGPDGTTTAAATGTATRCAASGDTFTLTVTGPGGSATDTVTVP